MVTYFANLFFGTAIMTLQNRVIVITGASSGIGAATAKALAMKETKLVLAARRMDKLNSVAEECRRLGAQTEAIACDVTRRDDVDQLAAATVSHFGRMDVMFANAGYGFLAKIQDVTDAQFDDIMNVNVKGSLYCMQAAQKVMNKQQPAAGSRYRGHIILTASGASRRGMPLYGIYSMTKAAQLSIAEAMRVELARERIYVSTVHPLTTATEFFDVASSKSRIRSTGLGHAMPVEKVADKIVRLIDKPRPELWPVFGSQLMLAIAACFPRLADFGMAKTVGNRTRT